MLIYAILFILLVVLYFGTIETEGYRSETTLSEDGFVVVRSKNDAIKQLPEGYVFLDYEFIIDGCALATFHRDVTSSQSQFNTKYPVYTYIEYDYDGKTLAVCPGSHATRPYLFNHPVRLESKNVLFNCELVHAGVFNEERKPRVCKQYKIAHVEDLPKLEHLQGIQTTKYADCSKPRNTALDLFYRKMSILFSYIINEHFTPYLQNRESGLLCKIIGEDRCFYNK